MFDNIVKFFKKFAKEEKKDSKDTAKERLHLVLMQDRANVSADFLELMKQEIIEVIKKYIDVDENSIDVRLTNKDNGDGTTGAPALYANIPIVSMKEEARKVNGNKQKENLSTSEEKKEEKKEQSKEENKKKESAKKDKKVEKEEKEKKEEIQQEEVLENDTIKEELEIEEGEEIKEVSKPEEDKNEDNKDKIEVK